MNGNDFRLLKDLFAAIDATDSVNSKKSPNLYCPGIEASSFLATWVVNESRRSETFGIFQKFEAAVGTVETKCDKQING